MTPYLLQNLLSVAAQRDPTHSCLVQDRVHYSYGEVEMQARRTAGVLQRFGLRRGDRVALLAFNSPFFVEAYFGILMAGGIVVPINTGVEPRGLRFFLAHCEASLLIMGRGTEPIVQRALPEIPALRAILSEGPVSLHDLPGAIAVSDLEQVKAESHAEPHPVNLVDLDVACIVYTSGSTGRPRGVTLTHRNCLANAAAVVSYLKLSAADRVLAILPFYYIYGKSVLETHVAAGATLVIENRFLYPEVALDTLVAEKCTGFSGVPSTFGILLNRSTFGQRRFPHLRYVTQAGGAMCPTLIRRLIDALPGKEVFIMYGATEAAGRLAYLSPSVLKENIGFIGQAIENVELTVRNADGSECEIGETGEIVARGSCVMAGYWNDSEATHAVLDPLGYHTGDLAVRHPNGNLSIVGRKNDMIKSGAHKIAAREIEDAILESSEVHEVAVVSAPDEILGEAIFAYVVPKSPNLSDVSLRAFLASRLSSYKHPTRIILTPNLPKNEAGKIMKEGLRQQARQATIERRYR